MDFPTYFILQSSFATCFSLLFFSLPGILLVVLLGLSNRSDITALLISPALGLCAFGPFALLFTWLLGYTVVNVLIAWTIFLLGACLVVSKLHPIRKKYHFSLLGYGLVITAALWALVPTINIYPAIYENGLFVNWHIHDHMKIAIINSIVREGLPPLNPYYAPLGERIPLIYYYAWHFDASLIKLLTSVSGWQAEVAFTWFTSFSTVSLLAALAIRVTGKIVTGFYVLLLALIGPSSDILPHIMGARWNQWVGHPDIHPLEVLWVQLSWAPQHVFAALCAIMLIFLITHALVNKQLRWVHAVIIGLITATGFGASVWVGGIALACAVPLVLLALCLSTIDVSKMAAPLLLALIICIVFSIPVLISITSGPTETDGLPLAIKSYLSTRLFDRESALDQIAHIILFWLQFLPLSFGAVYILGMLAIIAYRPKKTEVQLFHHLSTIFIVTYFLLVQFVKSDIQNNDFGWRTVLVPVMLLLIWAAVAITELPDKLSNWRTVALQLNNKRIFIPLVWVGFTLGLTSSFYLWRWPKPHPEYSPPDHASLVLHQDFFRLNSAWQTLQRYTADNDLVQSNPDSPYNKVVTRWSTPAAWALFANSPMAYTEQESVNVFAHSYSKQQKYEQYLMVKAIFAINPKPEILAYAHDTLNIKALLVDYHDPVWPGHAIETSGVFRLVEESPFYKIYLAN